MTTSGTRSSLGWLAGVILLLPGCQLFTGSEQPMTFAEARAEVIPESPEAEAPSSAKPLAVEPEEGPSVEPVPEENILPVEPPLPLPQSPEMPATASIAGEADDVPPAAGNSPDEVLSVDSLVEQVLTRNPSLAQMLAAWKAACVRIAQVSSLDDPMLGGTVGPTSLWSGDVDFAYRVEISQKLPFSGKLDLRRQQATSEARAVRSDAGEVRLQLIERTKHAFYDYYLASRALTVNQESRQLLDEIRQNARARFKAGQATQQDVLQADVEIGRQQERKLEIEQMRQVAQARLNTLLHMPPDAALSPAPSQLALADALPDVQALRTQAVAKRPDVKAVVHRLAAEEAALRLAHKEYYPDVEVMAAYDAFWQRPEQDLRPQVGVKLNLPVRQARRDAAVCEAKAKIAQRRAELAKLTDQVNYEIQEAYAQVGKSREVVRLYEKTILPAAKANVKAAQSAYASGKTPFLSLVEAQRNLVDLRERYYEAQAGCFRWQATLERMAGGT